MLISAPIWGQNQKIAVVHNGNSTYYANLTPALAAAQNGDTIYLPGGNLSNSIVTINKGIIIIGTGHNPDSTGSTGATFLNEIQVVSGADGGALFGIRCNNLQFGNSIQNQDINNFLIKQCWINNLKPSFSNPSNSTNITFDENIIITLSQNCSFLSVLFIKNIFDLNANYFFPATFFNNIFHRITGNTVPISNNQSIFSNNIFIIKENYSQNKAIFSGSDNFIENNLFCATTPIPIELITNGNISNNNIIVQSPSDVFQFWYSTYYNDNQFRYQHNYHLLPSCIGKNAGTDGNDVGIYGTPFPAKDGAVPFNPHISSKNISTQVSPTGVLNVDVKVSAQDR